MIDQREDSPEAIWRPIATAPPTDGNGLHLLVFVPRYGMRSLVVEAWVNRAHPGSPWVAENGGQIEPTHWMPLPAPPKDSGESEAETETLRERGEQPDYEEIRLGKIGDRLAKCDPRNEESDLQFVFRMLTMTRMAHLSATTLNSGKGRV